MTVPWTTPMSPRGAVLIAAPVGLAYDGTAEPVAVATLVCSALAWVIMHWLSGAPPAPRAPASAG